MTLRRLAAASITAVVLCTASMVLLTQQVVKADAGLPCIEKGTLTTYFKFCVSDTGRILQIESPQGLPQFTAIPPNFSICHSSTGNAAPNYLGSSFVPVSITQSGGPGTLPLTIVANSADGAWQVKHSYAVNTIDLELVLTVTLKRLGPTIEFAAFTYGFDDAPGNTLMNGYDWAVDSVEQTGNGYMLFYGMLTRSFSHNTSITNVVGVPTNCNVPKITTPGGPADKSTNLTYNFNQIKSGAARTMKFQIRRG
jgi:hypothetical protein